MGLEVTAIQIIRRATRQIIGNLREVIRISWLPLLSAAAVGVLLDLAPFSEDDRRLYKILLGLLMVILAVLVVPAQWILMAVRWHQYVFGEAQAGSAPRVRRQTAQAYLAAIVRLLLIVTLAIIIIGYLAFALSGVLAQPVFYVEPAHAWYDSAGWSWTTGVVAALVYAVLGLRLCVGLPAAAFGDARPITTAWNATKGMTGTFILLLALPLALDMTLSYLLAPVSFGGVADALLETLVRLIATWLWTFYVLSVANVIYSHRVLGKPLG